MYDGLGFLDIMMKMRSLFHLIQRQKYHDTATYNSQMELSSRIRLCSQHWNVECCTRLKVRVRVGRGEEFHRTLQPDQAGRI